MTGNGEKTQEQLGCQRFYFPDGRRCTCVRLEREEHSLGDPRRKMPETEGGGQIQSLRDEKTVSRAQAVAKEGDNSSTETGEHPGR